MSGNTHGYTKEEKADLLDLVDELPAQLSGPGDLSFEETIYKMDKIVRNATNRRAMAKADELLGVHPCRKKILINY